MSNSIRVANVSRNCAPSGIRYVSTFLASEKRIDCSSNEQFLKSIGSSLIVLVEKIAEGLAWKTFHCSKLGKNHAGTTFAIK